MSKNYVIEYSGTKCTTNMIKTIQQFWLKVYNFWWLKIIKVGNPLFWLFGNTDQLNGHIPVLLTTSYILFGSHDT